MGSDRAVVAVLGWCRGRPFRDHRRVIEGIVYRYRAGIAWRDLLPDFGPWQTAWKRHHRFAGDGTWAAVLTHLTAEADAVGDLDWNVAVELHDRAGASARRECCEVLGAAGPTRGGQRRMGRNRCGCGTNRTITASAVLAAV